MFYDLIIVARSSSEKLIQMTRNCINGAMADNTIVVETSGNIVDYCCKVVPYDEPFNYNRALNMGLLHTKHNNYILANNDVLFYDGWRNIGHYMKQYGFGSASAWYNGSQFPQGDYIYEGYNVAVHLTGWCIFTTKDTIQRIGGLSEAVDFWYSDNVYADQLKKAGIRHGIFCNERVDHLASQTLNIMPMRIKRQYSLGQLAKYNNLCKTQERIN